MSRQSNITLSHSRDRREQGFSLMETLLALVIMSFASLALFQSTSAMLSLSDRAVAAAERTVDKALDRRAVGTLLASLVPHWSERPDTAFSGRATELRGLSSAGLGAEAGLSAFTLDLAPDRRGDGLSLIYIPGTTEGPEGQFTLKSGIAPGAEFRYLGLDNRWYSRWPPEQTPVTPYFDDARYIKPASLPVAIKLLDGAGRVIFISHLDAQPDLPSRMDLARDTL